LLTCVFPACEQLNAWLGGFETILKRMTVYNFNWFMVMIRMTNSGGLSGCKSRTISSRLGLAV
jgi:hypothetical protein